MRTQSNLIRSVLLLLGCLAGIGCSVGGDGKIITENLTVAGFTKVKNITPIKLNITEGANFALTLSTDSNLHPLITTTVAGDTLEIGSTHRISPNKASFINLTLPEFRGATLVNSGNVEISGITSGRDVELINTGAAKLSFSGVAGKLRAEQMGIGPIDLEGSAIDLDANLSGLESINARPLTATNVRLVTTDSTSTGNIVATVNGGTAFISLGGMGNITLYGTTSSIEKTDNGGGSIQLFP